MKNKLWLLTIIGLILFTACGGSSSKEGKDLQQKLIKLVGIPQDIVANICQDNNKNGTCETGELQVKVSFNQGDSMETIWSKLTRTEEGRYLLETYNPQIPLLLELKDAKSPYYTGSFTLPFNGLKENEKNKNLSILQAMIDKEVLISQNITAVTKMKNVEDFYKILLNDLEKNIKILREKGLTTKEAVAGNMNEMAEELIINGIENTMPVKMNACNGDKTCVDNILNALSVELVLTDAEANSMLGDVEEESEEEAVIHKGKIDKAEYFPSSSVRKNFITIKKSPYQEKTSSISMETISKKDNTLNYQNLDDEEKDSFIVTIENDTILVKYPNVDYNNSKYVINRYINKGDITWKWTYTYKNEDTTTAVKYVCQLEDKLTKFSHSKYKYTGDIIAEKCTINSKSTYSRNAESYIIESSKISYEYYKKNIGHIASISNICYDERGIEQNTQGCIQNGYNYTYFLE